jgi:hypothetical protein
MLAVFSLVRNLDFFPYAVTAETVDHSLSLKTEMTGLKERTSMNSGEIEIRFAPFAGKNERWRDGRQNDQLMKWLKGFIRLMTPVLPAWLARKTGHGAPGSVLFLLRRIKNSPDEAAETWAMARTAENNNHSFGMKVLLFQGAIN